MIAMPQELANRNMPADARGKYCQDTGARFNGVKIRLLTTDPDRAEQLGFSLAAKGMPGEMPDRVVRPTVAVMPIILTTHKPTGEPIFLRWPNQKHGDIVVLETRDSMLREPFLRWLDAHYSPQKPEEKKPTLKNLADAGEIETFSM